MAFVMVSLRSIHPADGGLRTAGYGKRSALRRGGVRQATASCCAVRRLTVAPSAP